MFVNFKAFGIVIKSLSGVHVRYEDLQTFKGFI